MGQLTVSQRGLLLAGLPWSICKLLNNSNGSQEETIRTTKEKEKEAVKCSQQQYEETERYLDLCCGAGRESRRVKLMLDWANHFLVLLLSACKRLKLART